ncbi:MAG: 6-bladed beta-propeller, partial [Tannerella sp.]|nr:6-bladed beta-propeller [Tannerella sp.]
MKLKNLILLTSFFLTGSQVTSPQSKTGGLPVIDISKKYPDKKIRLQDIADIEYVPLETTDDVLLSDKAVLSYVSDKYMLV